MNVSWWRVLFVEGVWQILAFVFPPLQYGEWWKVLVSNELSFYWEVVLPPPGLRRLVAILHHWYGATPLSAEDGPPQW